MTTNARPCMLITAVHLFWQVENLVAIELSYINTNHPDFTDGAYVVSAMLSSNDPVCCYPFFQ